jgi:RNA polymerase sigma factor (sigma-70 family)
VSHPATQRAIEAVWRIESTRLIGALARMTGDVGAAEDLAQDALVAALQAWPRSGVPDNPGAWLTATAKHRAIDRIRRAKRLEDKQAELGLRLALVSPQAEYEEIADDGLRLIFTCCHPAVRREGRIALTLKLLGGLTTAEIARAFLTGEATVAQRIVRAKRTLASEHVPFAVPGGDELPERLSAVLEVLYLIFNEGYAASAGEDWVRPRLCEDALRLGRMLTALAPRSGEAWGLLALMELQASRIPARTGRDGAPVLLADQARGRWDRLLITRGLAALARAEALGLGAYGLQAEIAACHARAVRAQDTDWVRIAALYETLAGVSRSPVVELNRAVAIGMAFGPARGLAHVDRLAEEPALEGYHLLPSVRGFLLERLGREDEARAAYARAAALAANARERALLLARSAVGDPAAAARRAHAALPPHPSG